MIGFVLGLAVAGGIGLWAALARRGRTYHPDGPVSTSMSGRMHATAVASPHVTVNVQQVDAGTMAAMASMLAAAARAGHGEIPVPSARALELEAARLDAAAGVGEVPASWVSR